MERLKSCPFCGGEACVVAIEPPLIRPVMNHEYCVRCNSCLLLFGWDTDYGGQFDTLEEAAGAWNSRASDSAKHGHYIIDWLGTPRCSVCGTDYLDSTRNYCPNCGALLDEPEEKE